MANLKGLLTQKSVNLSLNLAPIYGKNHRRKEFSLNGYERVSLRVQSCVSIFYQKLKWF